MLNALAVWMLHMENDLLSRLLQALPLYSEEDDLREEVAECELRDLLPGEGGAGVLVCVRRIFEACAVLDQHLLAEGKWAFVSFPASLFGRSLLQTLATPGQQIFSSDFWRSALSADIEDQRTLLKELESRRVRLHPDGTASPIRFVFVAWGLIRLGGFFLLRHREDKSRPDIKNYVLPGGRFKPGDLPLGAQTPGTLRQLHQEGACLAIDALDRTLARELTEELGLHLGEDCFTGRKTRLRPYRRTEGSANNYSFSEYVLVLYEVSLTLEGESHLLDHVANSSETLVWFSAEDLANPMGRPDGKRAFIDALTAHFGTCLSEFLSGIPSSSAIKYRFDSRDEAVELPVSPREPLLVGETSKEKRRRVGLSEDAHALLLLLGAHEKGLKVVPDKNHLRLLPGGWIKAESDLAQATLAHLQAQFNAEGLPLLDQVRDRFVRLSVNPEVLYFSERLFGYRLAEKDDSTGNVEVELKLGSSCWSGAMSWSLSIPLKTKMFRSLEAIEEGNVGSGDLERFQYSDETMKKNCREMFDDKTRELGLRKLVRLSNKTYQITASRISD